MIQVEVFQILCENVATAHTRSVTIAILAHILRFRVKDLHCRMINGVTVTVARSANTVTNCKIEDGMFVNCFVEGCMKHVLAPPDGFHKSKGPANKSINSALQGPCDVSCLCATQ